MVQQGAEELPEHKKQLQLGAAGEVDLSHFSKSADSVPLSGVMMLIAVLINLSLSMKIAWNL